MVGEIMNCLEPLMGIGTRGMPSSLRVTLNPRDAVVCCSEVQSPDRTLTPETQRTGSRGKSLSANVAP